MFSKIKATGDAVGDSGKLTVVYRNQIVLDIECDSGELKISVCGLQLVLEVCLRLMGL